MQLNELMDLYAKLSDKVLALENTNTSQAAKIATLKERVKKLEKKRRSKTYKPRILYKVGEEITDLDTDTEMTLIDETQRRNDEDLMFDTGFNSVSAADLVTTADEVVTTASVEILEELTLAQTLIEIKSAKPKAVTTAATTVTPASSRPKAKGIVFHDQEEQASASTPIKKDQIAIDEEVARNLEAQLQAELERRLFNKRKEEANIALIES
ncbi:retrovirus-related pol polyprotein from transposon TNT 1-94 [Tanacetum coccineum]